MKTSAHLVLLVTLLFSAVEAFAQDCPRGVVYRKEVRTLTDDERNRFIAAVKKLQTPQEGNGISRYDQLVKVHIDKKSEIHNNAMYFPFHRAFLLEFERELQKIDPTVMVPYWNWSFDSQAPERSLVFSDNFMGGNGRSGGCVTNGAFASWKPLYPAPHCLQRRFDAGDRIDSFYSSDVINRFISQSRDYDTFRKAIEIYPAGSVQVGIGGDMSMMQSPNDPIYWLHIAYVDKIWSRWQHLDATPDRLKDAGNGFLFDGRPMTTATVIPGLKSSYKVGDVLDTKKLCYDYAELPATMPNQ
jgi:hypothetical protein